MKAIILNNSGTIAEFAMTELPMPIIMENEVLIQVKTIGLNPVDVKTRSGLALYERLKENKPLILGWDVSGVVVETGAKVSEFKKGDEVFGMVNFPGHGKCYAEYVAAPANHIALKPSNVSHEDAAAASLAALTAWQLLKHKAKPKPGDKILVQAASGGVGHYAVQMAKHFGAYVIGTSSSKNRDFIISLGADEHIAYDEQAFENIVKDVDFVLEPFAKDNLYKSLKVTKPGGIILCIIGIIPDDVLQKAKAKDVEIFYYLVKSDGEDMKDIADLLAKGIIKSHVSKVFPFEQMGNAHLEIEKGRTLGKIVVRV